MPSTIAGPASGFSILTQAETSTRLLCLDVYRGLMVAAMIVVDNPGNDDGAYWPIMHAKWNGWTPADFIFPSFLVLVGISIVYSFTARLERGETRKRILFHAFKRSLILIAIGLLVNASPIIGLELHTWRFEGVTQRIGICYFFAAILELWGGRRGQISALAACLVGYWALLRFVPVPGAGFPARDIPFMDQMQNLPAWLDRKLFMGHLYDGTRDPEGILHTIPAIGTTLIGVLTGHWLKTGKRAAKLIGGMALIGVLGLLSGLLWNRWFPINKNLWTSSFVLFSGGFALLFLSLLYWITEVKGWRGRWTMPILVFGMNAIAGFVADSLVYGPGYSFTGKGPTGATMNWHEAAQAYLEAAGLSTANASLVYSLGAVLFCWLLLWLLWRRKIFLKV
ncbi:MAG TPA: heparan-alpha-glucosaminide N-acetyltransferase domain-containing protein [Candidatus Acidoferrales bacterium]|jgi:predicted acyltransferase|nr:heparan-alpha-glucosaminide N-acetyltransferase domain-containing protein [Candidatus Acidoferrales bacterium]